MSKRIPSDMIGFKDFLEGQESKKPVANKRIDNLNYETTAFLEKDGARLDKHISLFEEKTYMIKSFPQDTKIIVDLETEIIERKIEIVERLKEENSALHRNLAEILEDHFSSL